MKTITKRLMLAAMMLTATLLCSAATAQDTPPPSPQVQKVLAPVESLINKNTFVMGYIDIKALDIDQSVANWKQLVNDLFAKIKADRRVTANLAESGVDLNAIQTSYLKTIDDTLPEMKTQFNAILKTGLKEVYVLANSRTMAMAPVRVVLTFEKSGSPDEFLNVLASMGPGVVRQSLEQAFHIEKRDGMLLFSAPVPGLGLDMANPADKARLQRMFDAIKPEANPAIAAGLERVKGAPIQVVFAPDSSLRGLITMGLAMAPEPVNKFGGKTLTDGIQWASAGLDPVKQIFALTIQSASPEAAQTLYDTANTIIDEAVAANVGDNQASRAYTDRIKVFVPQVKGDRLQLLINKQFLETQVASMTSLATTLIPAITAAGDAQKRMSCSNNIKQMVLALHNYHDAWRMFPPVMTADANGKPLHSWRVLLLPFIEEAGLYEQIRLNEPWDSEHNKQFHNRVPRVYQCHQASGNMTGMTSYSVVVGKECLFNEPNAKKGMAAIADGTSNTIAIVERKTPVCWMDPTQEITFEEACKGINVSSGGLGSNHSGGMNVGFFDGSVHFISNTIDLRVLRALFTCAGGEAVALP